MANSGEAMLTVARARSVLGAGVKALEERKQEINDLNVYPVPDGDTGTNLALTMRGILDTVAKLPEGIPTKELCAAISQAALMGARGNSGVILSQIVRGAMEILGEGVCVTPEVISQALTNATETAYRAVRRPVEGTMLTVLREMAEAAVEAPVGDGQKAFMDHVVMAGWKSVEKTPTLLKVLADAGVVDAGGFGLVVILEGAANGSGGGEVPIATHVARTPVFENIHYEDEAAEEESDYTYCTSFLLSGWDLDKASLEEELGSLGDSLLVVGDGRQIKVHVHTDDPGRVIGFASACGSLSEIEIDNMKEQTAARTKRLEEASARAAAENILTQVVAVVAGDGNKALFRSLGVDLIVEGGQSMNPSAEDLMRAVERAAAPSVVILPNNGNVIMTAEQTIGLTGREVYVVPTRTMQAGLSAAVAYDKRSPGDLNAEEMGAAIESVVAGEVTRAVRDSLVDGIKVKTDDYIGLIDDHVVVASRDLESVVDDVIGRLLQGDREMLTALLGAGEEAERAREAIERARERYPQVEMDVHDGGQPHYPVLLAAE
ncbi:MAG: DAK2 domain-containing protein [Thermoleophilia bacterium]|nr:DAK2 domain-containing protein [Thermoleophilia bacterium]